MEAVDPVGLRTAAVSLGSASARSSVRRSIEPVVLRRFPGGDPMAAIDRHVAKPRSSGATFSRQCSTTIRAVRPILGASSGNDASFVFDPGNSNRVCSPYRSRVIAFAAWRVIAREDSRSFLFNDEIGIFPITDKPRKPAAFLCPRGDISTASTGHRRQPRSTGEPYDLCVSTASRGTPAQPVGPGESRTALATK
jgi:hypothetical protein